MQLHQSSQIMPGLPSVPLRVWRRVAAGALVSALSFTVFAVLDLVDLALCFFFRFADAVIEGTASSLHCYCGSGGSGEGNGEEDEVSRTLHHRRKIFTGVRLLRSLSSSKIERIRRNSAVRSPRWSDCSCQICISWISEGKEKLHFVLKEPPQANRMRRRSTESVIFLHGFLSSSSLWAETVFPNISPLASKNFRLFAVDLLGFGKSPKPGDSLYTLKDHVKMIEETLIHPFQLDSFHLVAHSMGCIIALAIAEKYPGLIKSITLVAPPYFSAEGENYSLLERVAPRKIWPPLNFGISVMSWYEHLGRSICFLVCRCHAKWEWVLKLLTRRDLHFKTVDLTKHTHHSAWHTMHNVICGTGRSMDQFLKALSQSGIPAFIIHGSDDQTVPVDCSHIMKQRVPHLDLWVVPGADHSSIIMGRERDFTADLEKFWFSHVVKKQSL